MKGFPLGSQPCVLAGAESRALLPPGEARWARESPAPRRAAQAPAEGLMEPSFSLKYPTGSW